MITVESRRDFPDGLDAAAAVRTTHELRIAHAADLSPSTPRAFNYRPRVDKNTIEVKEDYIATQYGAIWAHSSR
ncbi:MAG TPA: hypothetical protein VFD64_09940 [Gemmatimonadaceae bacterium]|nr:hypothetical protein [Gemmatimonadaceae bacterium]